MYRICLHVFGPTTVNLLSQTQAIWIHLANKLVFTGLYRLFKALGRMDIYVNGHDEFSKFSDPAQGVNTPSR